MNEAFNPLLELLRNWRRILMIGVCSMIAAALLVLVLPRKYTARTVLYIPQPQVDPRMQALAGASGGLLGLSTGTQDTRVISTILSSRTLRDSIASRFGKIRDLKSKATPDGAITVEVTHRNADAAAKVANAVPDLINLLATNVGVNTHRRKQEFLRAQLADADARLGASESRLVQFQQGGNTPELDEQARRTVQAASDLQAKVAEKELVVAQLRRTLVEGHPQLTAAQSELAILRSQLSRLTSGRGNADIYVPLHSSPQLKAEAYRLLREFKTNEQIVMSLAASLSQADMDMRNSLPVVNVIDVARVPDKPSGPGLPAAIVVAFILGCAAATAWVLLSAWWNAVRTEPQYQEIVGAINKADNRK